MPLIPTYDGPQLKQAALDGGYQQAPDVSSGKMAIAKGLDDVAKVVDKIDLEQSTIQAQNAELKIRTAWYETDAKLRQEYSGEKIGGYQAAVNDWWKEAPQKFGSELSPRAQMLASKSLVTAQDAALKTTFTHVASVHSEQVKQNAANSIAIEQNSAVADVNKTGSTANTAVYVDNIIKKNEDQAKLNNWSADELSLKNLKDATAANLGVISALQANNPSAAKAYFDEVKKDPTRFDPKKVDDVERLLKPLSDAQEGGNTARAVFEAAMDGKSLNAEIPYKDLDKELSKKYGDDPTKLAAARQELDRQVNVWNKTQSEHEAGAVEGIFGLKNKGMSAAQIKAQPEWQNLSQKNQAHLIKQWQDESDAQLSRSVNRMALVERQKEMAAAPMMLEMFSNPEALTKVSRAQIVQMAPVIGMDNAHKLIQMQSTYAGSQAKLSEARIDNDMFDAVAASVAGIDPKPKASDKDAVLKAWNLRNAIETEIGQRQQAGKGELSRADKEKIATEVAARKVKEPGWFGSEVSAATLSPKALSEAKVVVGNKTIPINSVPTDEFASVKASLARRGLPSDDVSVVREWNTIKQLKK
jgi:hypothetical protein